MQVLPHLAHCPQLVWWSLFNDFPSPHFLIRCKDKLILFWLLQNIQYLFFTYICFININICYPVIVVEFSVQIRMRKALGQHLPLQPLPLLLQHLPNRREMACHTTSEVYSAGKKMKNLEIYPRFLLYSMPTSISLISSKTTQVSNHSAETFKIKIKWSPFVIKEKMKYFFTDWASRCKQIMKIWRKVSAPDKVPFLVRTWT